MTTTNIASQNEIMLGIPRSSEHVDPSPVEVKVLSTEEALVYDVITEADGAVAVNTELAQQQIQEAEDERHAAQKREANNALIKKEVATAGNTLLTWATSRDKAKVVVHESTTVLHQAISTRDTKTEEANAFYNDAIDNLVEARDTSLTSREGAEIRQRLLHLVVEAAIAQINLDEAGSNLSLIADLAAILAFKKSVDADSKLAEDQSTLDTMQLHVVAATEALGRVRAQLKEFTQNIKTEQQQHDLGLAAKTGKHRVYTPPTLLDRIVAKISPARRTALELQSTAPVNSLNPTPWLQDNDTKAIRA